MSEDAKAGFELCALHIDLNVFYAESEHDITSKITCAPRENSDQFSLFAGPWLSIECTTETGQTR